MASPDARRDLSGEILTVRTLWLRSGAAQDLLVRLCTASCETSESVAGRHSGCASGFLPTDECVNQPWWTSHTLACRVSSPEARISPSSAKSTDRTALPHASMRVCFPVVAAHTQSSPLLSPLAMTPSALSAT
eukprot:2933905-Prymnesium_polylepis.2